MTTDCPRCGTDNAQGASFCSSCGAPLAATCRSCGKALGEDARFCSSCGTPVAEPATAEAGAEERKVVTILFVDVTGSTTLGERLDPERLRDVMSTYFAAMREEIEAEGGTVEKFIGDAVMAAFGVPTAHEDDPSRALRAALRMRDRLVDVNEELRAAHGLSLQTRTGINSGEVIAAIDPQPGEPMVTGDAVNTAARLQSGAEPGEILVADRTAKASRGFGFLEGRTLRVKGKAEAVDVWALQGVDQGPERGVPGLHAPMVGRDRELDLLRSVYGRAAAERRSHLVTVYGDPGVGKSRLTGEFVTWTQGLAPQPLLLHGRCLPYGDGITYWPLAEILKAHAEILDNDPDDVALAKLHGSVDLTDAVGGTIDPARALAALAYTMGLEDPAAPLTEVEPRLVRHLMLSAWRGFLVSLAVDRPVVLVIDDIHWADPALLDMLEEMADKTEGPVVFLCPSRPELTQRRPAWGGGKRSFSSVSLEPLTADDADRLVSLLLTVDGLPPSTHELILARAEGNPFFLEEIIRRLIDEGRVVRRGDRWIAVGSAADVDIPDTVQGVLAARIDLLEAEDRRLLELAAVVGRVFWPGPVKALLNGEGDRLDEILRRLEERELVSSRLTSSFAGEPEYAFRHVLTRDVAYDRLPRRERARAHAAVAEWISASAAGKGEFVELLAYHSDEAFQAAREDPRGDPQLAERLRTRAFEVTLGAAEDARRRFAVAKALKLGERAVALASEPQERARALEQRGRTALDDYRGDLAWTSHVEAVEIRERDLSGDSEGLANACAGAVETPTRWPGSMNLPVGEPEVRRLIELGLSAAGGADGPSHVRLLTAKAFFPFTISPLGDEITSDDLERAKDAGWEAVEMAHRLGRKDLASAALDAISSCGVAVGDYRDQLSIVQRRLALDLDDPWELGDAFAMAAWAETLTGRFSSAAAFAEQGIGSAGAEAESAMVHNYAWLILAEFCAGNWARVVHELIPRVQELLGDRDVPYFLGHYVAVRAIVAHAQGDPVSAEAVAALERMGDARQVARAGWFNLWRAWIALRRRRIEEAEERLASDIPRAARPLHEQVRASWLADAERWDEVPSFLRAAREYASSNGLVALPVHLDRLEGKAVVASGSLDNGIELLSSASGGFARIGARWERACTQLPLARALLDAGRSDEARVQLDEALQVFEELRSLPEIERARPLLADLDR